jgi:hypothetical protein
VEFTGFRPVYIFCSLRKSTHNELTTVNRKQIRTFPTEQMASLLSLARPWPWHPLPQIGERPLRAFAELHSAYVPRSTRELELRSSVLD